MDESRVLNDAHLSTWKLIIDNHLVVRLDDTGKSAQNSVVWYDLATGQETARVVVPSISQMWAVRLADARIAVMLQTEKGMALCFEPVVHEVKVIWIPPAEARD